MKKAVFFIFLIILISGCGSLYQPSYSCKLALADSMQNRKDSLTYEDSIMRSSFSFNSTSISFRLKNKSSVPMYIDWDACSFIQYNTNKRVVHNGILLKNTSEPQPKTAISPGTILEDFIIPADNIYWGTDPIYGNGWKYKNMFMFYESKFISKQDIMNQKGTTISFLLSYEINGKKDSRIFDFTIKEVYPPKGQ